MATYTDVLLIAPDDVKSASLISYNVEDKIVNDCVRRSQNLYLEPLIGSGLLHELQRLVFAKIHGEEPNIDSGEKALYKELLTGDVASFLTAQALCELYMDLSVKVRNIGAVRESDTNITTATIEEITLLRKRQRVETEFYKTRISHFICANEDAFRNELSAQNVQFSPQVGKKFAETGLYLG